MSLPIQSNKKIYKISNTAICVCKNMVVGLLLLGVGNVYANAQLEQLKSAYVYKISQFIRWRDDAKKTSAYTPKLCVFSSKTQLLKSFSVLKATKAESLNITLMPQSTLQSITQPLPCDMVFLADDTLLSKASVSSLLQQKVVVITDNKNIADGESDINLFVEQDRLRFQISRKRESLVGFKFSASLLLLASSID